MPRIHVIPAEAIRTILTALLIAAIGVGGWWLWGRNLPAQSAWGAPPTGEQARYPTDPMAITELGGVEENYARIDTLPEVRAMQMLTDSEIAVYQEANTGRAKIAVSGYSTGKATVLLMRAADARAAQEAAHQLTQLQLSYGFRSAPAVQGVSATILDAKPEAQPGGRAHYAHGDVLARVEFRGPDEQQAHARFDALLSDQLDALPADG
jgi:hypothetical protein